MKKISLTKKYRSGTTFDEIVALYQFDAELREIFLKYLLQIERHIGNLMAYYFTEIHGISQAEYLNPNNYNNCQRNKTLVSGLIRKIYGAVNSKEYTYVNYYRQQYGNIPLWITTSVLTFGSLSKMYVVFPQSLRAKISKHFVAVNQKQLERYLSVLTKYRNVCAHGDQKPKTYYRIRIIGTNGIPSQLGKYIPLSHSTLNRRKSSPYLFTGCIAKKFRFYPLKSMFCPIVFS